MFSIVVPSQNMVEHLPILWSGIVTSGLEEVCNEVLFVDDGSTDGTLDWCSKLASENTKVRIIKNDINQGRFLARMRGAEEARADHVLFLDARVVPAGNFGKRVQELLGEFSSLMGCVDIDVHKSIFCLYWQRSHERIFWRHYRDTQKQLLLTSENYDRYLKGTGVYLCNRRHFVEICRQFQNTPLLSDDTFLMKEMVKTEPICIDPGLRVGWVPREDWKGFLKRLWDRGPGFVEYHLVTRRGGFFWIVILGFGILFGLLAQLAIAPIQGLKQFIFLFGLTVLSAGVFARNPMEWFRIIPLHVAVVIAFGMGIIRGIGVNLVRGLQGKLPKVSA